MKKINQRVPMRDLTLEKYKNEVYLDFGDETVNDRQKKALDAVRDDFGKEHLLYINGEFIRGNSGTFESRNPSSNDEVIGTFQSAAGDQAVQAMDHARKAFEDWQYVPARERAGYLFKAADIIRRRRLEINAWMISEAGKNFTEADADTCEAIDFLDYYAYEALRLDEGMGVIDSKGDNNKTIYMPMGAGLTISPWNFPFAIFTGMAMAPVVAGNTVVAKPAPDTPKMGYLLAEIMDEIGLPKGVFNYVTGDDIEVGENLARYEHTRFISFTGSMKVGLHLNKIAVETNENQTFIKRVISEMGGKNAIVVDADADLENAADSIVK
ncbi:MAG: aldehyde dehydrogenase family protein, partial [Balneolaceae bacterium]